uniref:C-type lectin domain-containing protein n=1 Tax=Cyprinodon variegatus TaxID=28743 RepID=A0A3Q2D0K7_CYPVA
MLPFIILSCVDLELLLYTRQQLFVYLLKGLFFLGSFQSLLINFTDISLRLSHCIDILGMWLTVHPSLHFDNNCYKYVATLMTWADAEKYCNTQGANLVSIHSLKEENFVKDLITNFDPAEGVNWIGLSDAQQDRAYFWSDGSPLDFTLWNAGEPNNAGGAEPCVHTNWGPVKKWNDKVCAEKYSFVCKARQVCQ